MSKAASVNSNCFLDAFSVNAFKIGDNGQVIGTGYQNSKKYGLSPKTFNKTGALSGGKKKLLSALKNKKVTSITTKYKNIDVSV